MLCREVDNYLNNAKGLPFFYVVGDSNYQAVLAEFTQRGVIVDRVSDFCLKEDRFPDVDEVVDYFRTLDVDYRQNKHVLIGLGEMLALRGSVYAEKILRKLKSTTLGTARVVLLLRSVSMQVAAMSAEDKRLTEQQRLYVEKDIFSSLTATKINYAGTKEAASGVKGLLRLFENAAAPCVFSSSIDFSSSLIPVYCVESAYAAIRVKYTDLHVQESLGTEEQWDMLYKQLEKNHCGIEDLYEKNGFNESLEDNLYRNSAGFEFRNWLFFLYLKQHLDDLHFAYLRRVVNSTEKFDDFKFNLLTEIVRVSRKEGQYWRLYHERKKLVSGFPESEIAIFIHENRIEYSESVYRLTDSTKIECQEILKWVARNGVIKELDTIYPALSLYLKDYLFECGKLSGQLTEYFKQYKLQKILNRISPEFLETVRSNAKSLPYTYLETRDSAILQIEDKSSAYLYWIDALGVEYLSYITELARERGLSMHVDITYAELPTITSINKGFFEKWSGARKYKESELDDIKHKDVGGYNFTSEDAQIAPIHLYAELEVIKRALDRAATELAMHSCKKFVIASDHGASRLAVIHRQEEKYDTDTKGEHSGRCCKVFADYDLPYAIEENGYLVLGDYGRFRGSRAANVEVHGGATLEEVVVPVITLTLKKQSDLQIRVLGKDEIYCDRHEGTTIQLYISDIENLNNVSVVINGNRYKANCKDTTHYEVHLSDIKRAKRGVAANIFDGDDLIGTVSFDIKGKTATVKNDFDDLF